MTEPKRYSFLLVRREIWVLTIWARLILLAVLLAVGTAGARSIYPFLAISQPLKEGVMVMDGWMPSFMVEQVAERFKASTYTTLIIVRPLRVADSPYESGEFMGHYLSESLTARGVSADRVHVVFYEPSKKNRTYQSAQAVKQWFEEKGQLVPALDIVTLGTHARRSRLLYETAFGGRSRIGVISIEDETFDGDHWWRSSGGIRDVPFELLAYLYAKFLFDNEE